MNTYRSSPINGDIGVQALGQKVVEQWSLTTLREKQIKLAFRRPGLVGNESCLARVCL